jgi:ankyrin repeat protein
MSIPESNSVKLALNEGRDKIAEYLIERGADSNFADDKGISLLMANALSSDTDFCELLLKHGAKTDKPDKKGANAIEYALLGRGKMSTEKEINIIITLLLDNGAKIKLQTFKAAQLGDGENIGDGYYRYSVVKRILEGLIKSGEKSGIDPVMEAAILGDSKKVEELINNNKMRKDDEQQILFYTAAFGNVETIKFLQAKGVDLKKSDKLKNTPISVASKYGQLEILKYLVSEGSDIEVLNNDKDTPLNVAIRNNQYDVAKYFIQEGAEIKYGVLDLA